MMLLETDRRCRRCKRRRMDDEPPEVQLYKTCAKCRIIERTKKKLKKPLAEETMRYGMRQFQEQNQNTDFMNDDMFSNDLFLNDYQNAARDSGLPDPLKQQYTSLFPIYKPGAAPANAQGSGSTNYAYQYGNVSNFNAPLRPNATSSGLTAFPSPQLPRSSAPGNGLSANASAAEIASAAIKGVAPLIAGAKALAKEQYREYQQKQECERLLLVPATHCELCGQGLNSDDSVSSIFRLCRPCYSDPYKDGKVFSDFNDFISNVVTEKSSASSYISELASYLVESLNTNRSITSEEQFRKLMFESFIQIYVDPLLALLTPLKFSKTGLNLAEVNSTSPIISKISHQFHYTLTPPLRVTYEATSNSDETTVEMIFLPETNVIIMKKQTKKNRGDYSEAFLKTLREDMAAKGFTFDDDPKTVYTSLSLSVNFDLFVKDFKSLKADVNKAEESGETE